METKKETKTLYTCPICGSPNVQGKYWVNLNNPEIKNIEAIENEDFWCDDCENYIDSVNVTEAPKDAKVIGYQVVGRDGTKLEGKIHPDMAGSFCVYPLKWAQARNDRRNWRLLTVWEGDIEEPTFVNPKED